MLGAIGSGERTFSTIARAAGDLPQASLTRALRLLTDKRIVESSSPLSEPAPLLAGGYMCLPTDFGWPNRHLLDQPEDTPQFFRRDQETMVLTCTCGTDGCWALMVGIQVGEAVVRWSGFRNIHRDWDLSALGDFTFSRPDYERSLRRTAS